MPRATARLHFPGAFKAPRELTVQDGAVLEAALGQQIPMRVRKKIGTVVASFMMRIPVEKNALSVVEARRKIRSLEKHARRLRESIWYQKTQAQELAGLLAAQLSKSDDPNKDNLQRFRQSIGNTRLKRSDSVLASLANSLDAVIACCDLAITRLAEPEDYVEDGFVFSALAIKLRRICKANGLPFKVRKDSDKMKRHSPFSRFIDILQERLALHPSVSMHAMAGRVHRLEERLSKRDRGNIKN